MRVCVLLASLFSSALIIITLVMTKKLNKYITAEEGMQVEHDVCS